ncbi:MAG: hypothetical protein OHK0039_19610 [Bacteroidia bacterium]
MRQISYSLRHMVWAFLLVFAADVQAATLPPGFIEAQVATGLNPVAMTLDHHGRVWIAEKHGVVRIVDTQGDLLPDPFVTLPVDDYNERGLLGIALHPDFHAHPFVYLYYTVPGQHRNRVIRLMANGDLAVPGSEETLIDLDPMPGYIHNAGAMVFDAAGYLYIATGEGAAPQAAQDLASTHGKVLRLWPDGRIPSDNPFYTQTSGKYRAIWAYGFRNPFSMTYEAATDRIWVGDVGAGAFEEVNLVEAGRNYGWPLIEGPRDAQQPPLAYRDPFFAYDHDAGCAIAGAAVYPPGQQHFPAAYAGGFFFGDYCEGHLRWIDTLGQVHPFATGIPRPLALLVDEAHGFLYYLSRAGMGGGSPEDNTQTQQGALWRISYVGEGAPHISVQPQDILVPAGETADFVVQAQGSQPLTYRWLVDGLPTGDTLARLSLPAVPLSLDGTRIWCVVTNGYGSDTSATAVLAVTANQRPQPQILLPTTAMRFRAGDSIRFAGQALDPETGLLPPSALRWWVDWHHHTHTHPGLRLVEGVSEGGWRVPVVHETDTNIWYRIYLQATDTGGLSRTVYQDFFPALTALVIEGPAGIEISADGKRYALPARVPSLIGLQRMLEAPASQTVGDTLYRWVAWEHGGTARLRTLFAPAAGLHLRARYEALALGQGSGLWGSYFDDPELDLDGEPQVERLDTTVHFGWGDASPLPGMLPRDYFTVRWQGEVQAVLGEMYTFVVRSDDGCRLWVGDSLLIDQWVPQAPTEHSAQMTLQAGQRYPILLEYMEIKGGAEVSLQWSSPSTVRAVIPRCQLYPLPFFYPARLSGSLWVDADKNGFRDVGERLLAGVELRLLQAADTQVVARCTSDAAGGYAFGLLAEGDYVIQVLTQSLGQWYRPGPALDAWGRSPRIHLPAGEHRVADLPLWPFEADLSGPFPELVCYPNPTSGQAGLRFYAVLPQAVQVSWLDMQGRTLGALHTWVDSGTAHIELPLAGLSPGQYVVRVQGPQGVRVLPLWHL